MKKIILFIFVISLSINVFGGKPDYNKYRIDSLAYENLKLNAKIDTLTSQIQALSLYIKGLQSSINEILNTPSSKNVMSGVCGEKTHWKLNIDTGVLEITGSGEMTDYADENKVPWHDYASSIFTLLLSEGITHIGDYAFCKCTGLKQPKLPNTITSIGNHSFESCTKLEPIIPNSVTTIGDAAFKGCTFTSFVIPEDIKVISASTFEASSITSITIPSSVTTIGDFAFARCISLTQVIIPTSVRSIDNYAFEYCESLKHITLPSSIKSIGICAFDGCAIEEIIIPDGITKINNGTFGGCKSLKKVSLPSSLTEIGEHAFSECTNLTNINVSHGVKIGTSAFYHTPLANVYQ